MNQELPSNEEKSSLDFYIENGCCVFTETYHLKRGYCCNHGCRHCPWKEEENIYIEKTIP